MKFRTIAYAMLLLLCVVGPAVAQDVPTITISTWAGVDEAAEFQVILDEINASQSEYQVVHQPIPADYYTVVQTQLAAPGSGADMYWIDQNNMALKADGVFMDVSECLADAEAGTAGDLSDYYPGILAVNEYEGGVYGLPWIAQPVVLYFNRGLFDASGVEYPNSDWTWDDFTVAATELTQDTDADGEADQWGFINNSWPPVYIFAWQAGGELISEDFTEAPVDSPEFLEGLEFWLSTAYNPEMSPSREVIAEQGFGEMFKAGRIAMFMGGAADDLDRVEGLDVGVVRVPANPETGLHTTFAWNASTVINASSPLAQENPQLLCDALVAITEGIHHWKILSPRISQGTAEFLAEAEPRKADSAEAIVEAAQDMRALPIFGDYAEFDTIFNTEFVNPLLNDETDLTPAELAAEIRPELEDTLP